LLVERNVIGNVITFVPVGSRGQRDLSSARGSGKLSRTGRQSGMALEGQ
jgi:hypothetical protein